MSGGEGDEGTRRNSRHEKHGHFGVFFVLGITTKSTRCTCGRRQTPKHIQNRCVCVLGTRGGSTFDAVRAVCPYHVETRGEGQNKGEDRRFRQGKGRTALIPSKRERRNPFQQNKGCKALIPLKQEGRVTIGGFVLKWGGRQPAVASCGETGL